MVVDDLQFVHIAVDVVASHIGWLIRHSVCVQVPLSDHTADVGDRLDADRGIAMLQHESAGEAFLFSENVVVAVAL